MPGYRPPRDPGPPGRQGTPTEFTAGWQCAICRVAILWGSRKQWGWVGAEKHPKALLSTQAHSETLMAGQNDTVAVSQMGKDHRVLSVGGLAMCPDLTQVQSNFPPECRQVKLHKVPSHRKRQDSSHTE